MLIRWSPEKSVAPAIGEEVMVKLKMPRNPVFGQRWMLFRAQVVRVNQAEDSGLMIAVNGSPLRFTAGAESTEAAAFPYRCAGESVSCGAATRTATGSPIRISFQL